MKKQNGYFGAEEHALMVDSSRILQQIQAEQVPDIWRVIRPQNRVRFATIFSALLFGLLFTLFSVGFGAIILYNTSNQQLGNNPLDLYLHAPLLAIVAHVVAIGLTLWLTLLLRHHAINLQDAVLVLLPAGIFHCKRLSDGNRRSMKFIEYKKIQRIVLKVSKGGDIVSIKVATVDLNALNPSSLQEKRPVPHIFGRFEFHFHYRNGTRATWVPPQGYERELHEIAQWVLDDYRAFALEEFNKQKNQV